MSLGLVSYDTSDESENDDTDTVSKDEPPSPKSIVSSKTNILVRHNDSDGIPRRLSDNELETNIKLEKSVNLVLPESKLNTLNTDIDIKCLTSTRKKNAPVRITIPSLSEVEEDAEQPSKKKLKPSQKGSGLFALLPSPKSVLVPQSVMHKNQNISKKKTYSNSTRNIEPMPMKSVNPTPVVNKPSLITYEASDDEEESSGSVDFFSLDSKDDVAMVPLPGQPVINQTGSGVSWKEDIEITQQSSEPSLASHQNTSSSVSSQSTYPTHEYMNVNNEDLQLDQEAMQQLCGRRNRMNMQEVNLIDVSGDAIMPDSREWLTKQLTEETSHRPSNKKRDGPTTQQKRKHQITYLAFQAKENELELKNQWANNRMSRKQTQAKYGF